MKRIGIREAKANLAYFVQQACMGDEIIITRGKNFAVRLDPIGRHKGRRKLGILKRRLFVGAEFFEPLPPEELKFW
jgi:antitoxin (DNA-binding transcriptional repressor) of toxin-antitoxin stability system